jgi:DNA-binding NtrC family response regulator
MKRKVLIISNDSDSVKRLSEVVMKDEVSLSVYDDLDKAIRLTAYEEYEIYFIDSELGLEKSLEYAGLLMDFKNRPCLVVLVRTTDQKMEATARTKGISFILEKPLQKESILMVLESKEWEEQQSNELPAGRV